MNSQRVSEFMSREIREPKITKNEFTEVVAYPQNNVREIAKIMSDIKIDCLPVFLSPWKRELVGFIELSKIRVFLND